jgi:hypothetical protein
MKNKFFAENMGKHEIIVQILLSFTEFIGVLDSFKILRLKLLSFQKFDLNFQS